MSTPGLLKISDLRPESAFFWGKAGPGDEIDHIAYKWLRGTNRIWPRPRLCFRSKEIWKPHYLPRTTELYASWFTIICCFIIMFGSVVTGSVTKPNSVQRPCGAPYAITQMWQKVYWKRSSVPSIPFVTRTKIHWQRKPISVPITPNHLTTRVPQNNRKREIHVRIQQEWEMVSFPICIISCFS